MASGNCGQKPEKEQLRPRLVSLPERLRQISKEFAYGLEKDASGRGCHRSFFSQEPSCV